MLTTAHANDETLSYKLVRQRVEERLGLGVDALKERRKLINGFVDEKLASVNAGSDANGANGADYTA